MDPSFEAQKKWHNEIPQVEGVQFESVDEFTHRYLVDLMLEN